MSSLQTLDPEDVTYENTKHGVTIAVTLTIPAGEGADKRPERGDGERRERRG